MDIRVLLGLGPILLGLALGGVALLSFREHSNNSKKVADVAFLLGALVVSCLGCIILFYPHFFEE